MPTLEIDGIGKVKIDDADWNNLNNKGKQELVNRIAREGTTPEPKENIRVYVLPTMLPSSSTTE